MTANSVPPVRIAARVERLNEIGYEESDGQWIRVQVQIDSDTRYLDLGWGSGDEDAAWAERLVALLLRRPPYDVPGMVLTPGSSMRRGGL